MARVTRRSARLQKTTSASESPSAAVAVAPSKPTEPTLPAVTEAAEQAEEAPAMAEDKAEPQVATPTKRSQLASPQTASKIRSLLSPAGARTPKNKTPIRPPGEEMHPQHHHQSTTTPFEEARWLGFLSMGAQTAPARGTTNQLAIDQGTPTKAVTPARNLFNSPEFKFRFKRPSELELSPTTKKIMEESRKEAAKIRASMAGHSETFDKLDKATETAAKAMATPGRKIKQAKSATNRFSSAHKKAFDRMDSIANHPSAFRANANRLTPKKGLKRSQSKAELDKSDDASSSSASTSSGPTVRMVPPSRHGEPAKSAPAADAPVKRVKRVEGEDTSTRPSSREGEPEMPRSPPGHGVARFTASGIPRLPAFLTPTKSSLARSQSVKQPKTTSMLAFSRSPSHITLTPSKVRTGGAIQAGLRKASNGFNRMKSILRSPQRQFSNDPVKIAAGTHVPTPTPEKADLNKDLPAVPATAPVARSKRVGFTDSVVARAERDEAANYPQLPTEDPKSPVGYPTLPSADQPESPSRRATLSDLPIPGAFSFRSDRQVSFSGGSTVRKVRRSDATEKSIEVSKKRKVETIEELSGSDKENTAVEPFAQAKPEAQKDADEARPAKKLRTAGPAQAKAQASPAKTPSRLPKKVGNRRNGLTPSRLNFLAMPKRK